MGTIVSEVPLKYDIVPVENGPGIKKKLENINK